LCSVLSERITKRERKSGRPTLREGRKLKMEGRERERKKEE
jgi:hypothetical protein